MSRSCDIANGSTANLYVGRDVLFSRQNEVGFSEPLNLLQNPEWVGATSGSPGDVPTGWQQVYQAGIRQTAVTEVSGFNSVRFRVESARWAFAQIQILEANSTYSFTAKIRNNIPIELLQVINGVTIPSGASQTYYLDGVQVNALTQLSVGDQNIEVRIQTAGSGGTASIRFGVGTTAARTGDVEISRPVFAKASRIGERIPLLLSNSQMSADGNPATYTGKAHFDASLEQSNCLTFDGVDDYISMDLADVAGPELVPNGTFDSNIDGWVATGAATIAWDAGRLSVTRNSTATDRATVEVPTEIDGIYLVSYDQVQASVPTSVRIGTSLVSLQSINSVSSPSGGALTSKFLFKALSSSTFLSFGPNSNETVLFDNISVKKLPVAAEPKYSPNLFSNPGFDTDTVWSKTNVTVESGKAVWNEAVGNISQSGIGSANQLCRLTVTISDYVSGALYFRDGQFNYLLPAANGTHEILFFTTGTGAAIHSFSPTTLKIDDVSLQIVSTIDNDGTSLLTYRSEGDGINGTAGTAYNIRLGDVEHIPCSEGAGDVVHGTKLNRAYLIVNGQASNWEDKQDDYHYNITEGCTVEYDFVPSGAVFSRSNQPVQDRFGNYIVVRS